MYFNRKKYVYTGRMLRLLVAIASTLGRSTCHSEDAYIYLLSRLALVHQGVFRSSPELQARVSTKRPGRLPRRHH